MPTRKRRAEPGAVARNFLILHAESLRCGVAVMRGGRSTIYADGQGLRWRVRELLRPDDSADPSDEIPPVTQATLVFEARGERRFVDGAPLDWRDRRAALAELFARARPLGQSPTG